jgi:hypothetical protein
MNWSQMSIVTDIASGKRSIYVNIVFHSYQNRQRWRQTRGYRKRKPSYAKTPIPKTQDIISGGFQSRPSEINTIIKPYSSNFSTTFARLLLAANCGVQTPMNKSSHSSSS